MAIDELFPFGISCMSAGCGWIWAVTLVKWWDLLWETVLRKHLSICLTHCPMSIVSAECAALICEKPMALCFRVSAIVL